MGIETELYRVRIGCFGGGRCGGGGGGGDRHSDSFVYMKENAITFLLNLNPCWETEMLLGVLGVQAVFHNPFTAIPVFDLTSQMPRFEHSQGLVIYLLLLVAGIEPNPGPANEDAHSNICRLMEMDDIKHLTDIRTKLMKDIPLASRFSGTLDVDDLANALLPDLPPEWQSAKPCKTQGGGNCLFNASSLILLGDYRLAPILRQVTAIELFLNCESYINHSNLDAALSQQGFFIKEKTTLITTILSDEAASEIQDDNSVQAVQKEAKVMTRDKTWCGFMGLLALSSVLNCPVYSVYPEQCEDESIRVLYHGQIQPSLQCDLRPAIALMWSREGNLDSRPGAMFEPNHFVPLVISDTPDVTKPPKKPSVQTQCTITNFFTTPGTKPSSTITVSKRNASESSSLPCLPGKMPRTDSAAESSDAITDVSPSHPSVPTEPSNIPHASLTDPFSVDHERKPVSSQLDICNNLNYKELDDNTKCQLIYERMPEISFKFPPKEYSDKRKKGGILRRYCNREWLVAYPFLVYSKIKDGLFCLCCVIFPTSCQRGAGRAKLLISTPYQNWKDALSDIKQHAVLQYHMQSMAMMEAFIDVMQNPSHRLELTFSTQEKEQVKKNRTFLRSIIKCLEVCGRQGIGLRGHRDDGWNPENSANEGNFKSLLKLRIDAGDTALAEHLETCKKNATYISKTAQNDLLICMLDYIQEQIVIEVKEQTIGPFYGVMADEITDKSNWEQLGIVVRYVKNCEPYERLLEYISCPDTTGEAISLNVQRCLTNVKLDIHKCRAQTYDGAGNMAGKQRGCAARIQEIEPKALYLHCTSHNLNLALSKGCNVPEIHCMLCALKSVGLFFKFSPKRQRCLERSIEKINNWRKESTIPGIDLIKVSKAKVLCETRWVERHTTLEDFNGLFEAVLDCMDTILTERTAGWDAKTITEANGIASQISSATFMTAFQVSRNLFGYTKGLSILLQGTTKDIINAYEDISIVLETLKKIRSQDAKEFSIIFKDVEKMATVAGCDIEVPRRCRRQTLRNNVEANTAVDYYRRAIFIPFLDNLISEMGSRFGTMATRATKGMYFIPTNLKGLNPQIEKTVVSHFKEDLPSPGTFSQEVRLWVQFWESKASIEELPSTLSATLLQFNQKQFPNMATILHLLLLCPVTSASVERSNSSLKFVKNVYRSTMGDDRMNALLLLFIHKDIAVNIDTVIDMYASRHPRRMLFLNPLDSDKDV